jgi:1-aminocyclopropane-1-carboxylate deaminase/D-cysteine desulfhydrase-like pyridoxal-dependent ACC family enzyme
MVKRDDIYPEVGGGNKARKLSRIVDDIKLVGANAIVTNGGTQSNHARAVAILAARLGWKCHVVLHGEPHSLSTPVGNLLLMVLSGARISIVEPQAIGETLELAMEQFRSEGLIPYAIPGGGHCVAGSLAYLDAARELVQQCRDLRWEPDWIVHASGTGTTQAGLVAGLTVEGLRTRVLGVSIARRNPRGASIVTQALDELALCIGSRVDCSLIDFRDEWAGGGYERVDARVIQTIEYAARREGLILDPTYTGKAFTALVDLVTRGEIPKRSRVVFWHTGGILNLMAGAHLWCSPGGTKK